MDTKGTLALAGRRVIELTDPAGAYCGKLFADMGAEVIKVERPGGDAARFEPPFWNGVPGPDRSLPFLYHNTNKCAIQLDLESDRGRDDFRRLAEEADLVIETLPPGRLAELGLGYGQLAESNPALVLASITGFGQDGPHRSYRSADIVANALGGAMYVTGEEEDPPVKLAGSQAHLVGSMFAAVGSMFALHRAARTGRGQHVDVSLAEAVAAASHIAGVGKWLEDGIIPRRVGTGLVASCPSGAFPCRDGQVYLMVNRPLHWKALAEWIHEVTGNREVLDPMFDGPSSSRLPYRELLDLFIGELTSQLDVDEAIREGQRRHIAFTPINTGSGVIADPHLAERGFFVEVDHGEQGRLRHPGVPYHPTRTPPRNPTRPPRVGEHDARVLGGEGWARPRREDGTPKDRGEGVDPSQALSGLRIVEFTAGLAGPWIGRLMAYCGAEVIKVESEKYPDVTRLYVPPDAPEMGNQPRLSPWFTDWNGGKKFVSLDLEKPESVELCKRLAGISDVVVENYSTGVLAKLGLGYEALSQENPELVMVGSTGYGATGPNRSFVTWGPNIEAHAGLAYLSGFPERNCTMTQFAYPDPLSALHGLFAVMCALEHRDRTSEGQYIEIAQLEVTVAAIGERVMEFLANGEEPRKLGNRSMAAAPQGCYRCSGEDRWIAISVASDEDFRTLCEVAEHPEWAMDARFEDHEARVEHADELDSLIEAWTGQRNEFELMERLQAAGVAAGVAQNTEDQVERDPQFAARKYFERIPHGVKGTVTANGIPLRLSETPGRTTHAGNARGEHNAYVFRELLGLEASEYAGLVDQGVIEEFDD
ncbi:CoA transferase [Myxococcota bacterium]|nr:CoA transferase [Myxococcota bacterium]